MSGLAASSFLFRGLSSINQIGEIMLKLTMVCFLCLLTINSFAGDKVIYGEDNRVEVSEASPKFAELARSTAAMIKNERLYKTENGFKFSGKTLEERGICPTERFANQITTAVCSGFLVGKDLLVTAGHCITSQTDCNAFSWVFDYKSDSESLTSLEVSAESVYKCKKIVSRKLSSFNKNDYALIKLEREVTDRTPLKYRKWGKVKVGTELVVIGHPTGLPTKVAAGGIVRSRKSKYFVTNLDTFGGNSGSAVFNAKTGLVEGILVRGESDYVRNSSLGCDVVKHCGEDSCRGEDVTFIKNVSKL